MSRYIDADEIVYFNDTEEDRPIVRALVAYKGQIDRIPSADVAPVVHGHWENKYERHYIFFGTCSVCKHVCQENIICGNCGAKMDESKEENHNMTKEEAIKQLIDLKDDRQSFLGGVDDEIYLADIEAIDFAVKHLQNDCRSDSGLPDTQKHL